MILFTTYRKNTVRSRSPTLRHLNQERWHSIGELRKRLMLLGFACTFNLNVEGVVIAGMITRDFIEAHLQGKNKAPLRLAGAAGMKSEYHSLLTSQFTLHRATQVDHVR